MTELLEKKTDGEEDMSQFLREIRSYPLLTAQEERQLARDCAAGDQEAIRRMVNSNLRLVVSVAREYAGRGVALLDLIQEGSIGLLAAARKFDHTREVRFSTYATKWIRQGVTKCLLNHGSPIRVPVHTNEQMRKIQAVRAALCQELDREPTAGEIARRSDLSEAKVRELMQLTPEVCSLDIPVDAQEKSTLGDYVEDDRTPQPYENLVRQELEQTIDGLLSMLDDRQRRILRLHFGMEDGRCWSLEEISKVLGISKERTRQIEHQAMERLQKAGKSLGLEDFLNE